MKISKILIQNVRGFTNETIEFASAINVLIGPNNSGKSTILKSILRIQNQTALTQNDVTIGQSGSTIILFISDQQNSDYAHIDQIQFSLKSGPTIGIQKITGNQIAIAAVPNSEPKNLFYLFLSKRKVGEFNETINEASANGVLGNFSNLYSKIDRLNTPQYHGHTEYIRACQEILGIEIASIAKGGGKHAVYLIGGSEHIPITAMGEGVTNILGLITDLCVAEGKIFLIEEPENDMHPTALKALMNLILKKSTKNQFFVSTHSHIVMKYLGGVANSKVLNVTNNGRDETRKNLFLSKVTEIPNHPIERKLVLESLGYEFYDFDLWKGWLFLEESSAEVIIRDYLIVWFFPSLVSKLRTFSAGGVSAVEPKFEDFNKLFVFLHLEPSYKNKVWVIIDSGEEENQIIGRLRGTYLKSGWKEENFSQFVCHDFEKYYPENFTQKVDQILEIDNKQTRRKEKQNLLEEVKDWIRKNPNEAKNKFEESARDVIDRLRVIEGQL